MGEAAATSRLERGDHVPWFHQRTTNNSEGFFFGSLAGRRVVVCAFGTAGREPGASVIGELLRHRDLFDDENFSLMGVSVDPNDERLTRVRQVLPGFRCFWDFDHRASRAVGASAGPGGPYLPRTIVLDERLRVLATFPLIEAGPHATAVVGFLRSLPGIAPPAPAQCHAPVLVIPNVLEPELCRALIDHYDRHEARQSGTMNVVGGRTVYTLNRQRKRRSDCMLPDDHPLRAVTLDRVRRRIIPAIAMAFQFRATRIERYLVACYSAADAGFFTAHRDNTTAGTAHRRFAVSMGLNDDYDGGELLFREFGRQRFKVPAGGAVVFGCSLLHEVRPVTRGDRYAFLPFLYDEEGARVRAANAHLVDHD